VKQHVDFLTYKVEQLRKFYGDLLGFPTEQGETDLNYLFVHTSATSSIGFMPPHPQMTSEQPPPKESTLYFVVENVDRVFAKLMAAGVAFMGPPQEMPWGHRVVMTHDPEGRTVMLGSAAKKG
jgi:predicted enzyme related to lactoylglutathione lyase